MYLFTLILGQLARVLIITLNYGFKKKNLNELNVKKNKRLILLDISINNATTLKTITLQII